MSEGLSKITAAWNELDRICKGERKFTMCIPVQPTDSDIVIGDALRFAQEVAAEIENLKAALSRVSGELNYYQDLYIKENTKFANTRAELEQERAALRNLHGTAAHFLRVWDDDDENWEPLETLQKAMSDALRVCEMDITEEGK